MIENINKPQWMTISTWGDFLKANASESGLIHCVECNATDDMTIDHIVPRVIGGSNTISNMQPMCRSCNSKKGTRVDNHWGKHHYFDTPIDLDNLRISQNDFVYAPILENRDFFTRPWSNINGKLFLYAQIVGAGKTLGMFALPFALNEAAGPGAPRVDRTLIVTKDTALRKQIANELIVEPVEYGIADEAPRVIELTKGETLLNPPEHDIAVMCRNMLWPEKDGMEVDKKGHVVDDVIVQWSQHAKEVVDQYQLVIFDEVHYAYANIAKFIRVATRSLVFGFTASPITGAGALLEDMVRMSVYGYDEAVKFDNSMKWLGQHAETTVTPGE